MTDALKPTFENAPGFVVRQRRSGVFAAWWQCRTDLAKRGFRPKIVPLWHGFIPTGDQRRYASTECRNIQVDMLVFGRAQRSRKPPRPMSLKRRIAQLRLHGVDVEGRRALLAEVAKLRRALRSRMIEHLAAAYACSNETGDGPAFDLIEYALDELRNLQRGLTYREATDWARRGRNNNR